ncbi:amino acid permease 4-like [Micractinium conductrix]|uniref:Amino acid permease 4-like n=1 Tax=Micractinium conductrix TaxID=554055 RepID=A0A2P6VJ32_9CHLO|nr:amino acid permease 4-like [Micractinium conductrix]|eukprot:PSC74067.1 amino acid permease 4-like [Micractinium conductrix]
MSNSEPDTKLAVEEHKVGSDAEAPHPHKVLKGYSVEGGALSNACSGGVEVDKAGIRRTGGVWSTLFLVITAVIGSGVLSLPYSLAMLGWVAGIVSLLVFAWITLYTSQLLADCHIVDGERTRSYIEQVGKIMGRKHLIIIAWVQQVNLVLTALAYSITATYAMVNVANSVCEANGTTEARCFNAFWKWALIHGGMQFFFSYIPDMDSSIWPCVLGAFCSFLYSFIALGRALDEISETNTVYGTVSGISGLSSSEKAFGVMNSLGAIQFAFNFSMILPEIQDTIKDGLKGGPIKAMRRTVNISVALMTGFYLAVAVSGYLAYGNDVAGNILDSFATPRWLVDMANIAVIIHLLPAYQVWSQPFFFIESNQASWWGKRGRKVPKLLSGWYFRAWFRPLYVAIITFLTVCVPFFSYIIGFAGALGFWPATVYYPIEMWIKMYQPSKNMRFWLEALNIFCLVSSIVALIGAVQLIVVAWGDFCFFCDA